MRVAEMSSIMKRGEGAGEKGGRWEEERWKGGVRKEGVWV